VDKRYISYNTHDTVPVFCVNLSSIETLSFQLPTEKPRRPGPEARNRVALMLAVVTTIVVALGGMASGSEYTPVSGPDGPLTRRYARSSTGPLRQRKAALFVAISGSGFAGRVVGLVKSINAGRLRRVTATLTGDVT